MKHGLTLTPAACRFLLLKLDVDRARDDGRINNLADELELRPDELPILQDACKAHAENLSMQAKFYENKLK